MSVTPSIALVMRYWCAIGTIGTVTPASARDLRCVHPAREHHGLGFDGAVVGDDARTLPSRTTRSVTARSGLDGDARLFAPPRNA